MSDPNQELCQMLVREFPRLRPVMDEHVKDYEEVLPYVFLADVTRYLLDVDDEVTDIVSILDQQLSKGSDEVRNLIGASFIENLDENEFNHIVANAPADSLREQWRIQHMPL